MANYSRFPPEIKENPVLVCTAWVHGIHPGRLSYFTDNLWKLIVEIDVGGLRGHEKVGIREEEEADFEKPLDESFDEINCKTHRNTFVEERLLEGESLDGPSPPELGRATGRRGDSKWWRAQTFFDDLTNDWVEKQGVRKEEFWRTIEKWALEGKVIKKSGAYFRSEPLSWDGVR